ncbi:MAG: MBL fold metallo-hydrolase [Oscillospiraceae bacterium]
MRQHRSLLAAGLLCVLLWGLAGCAPAQPEEIAPLKVTLFRVGKADAIVVQAGAETMVIDVGEEEDGEEVVEFLRKQGVERVDVLLITHFDRDHVGGADTLVESVEVGQVLLPAYAGTSTEYLDFMAALETAQLTPTGLTDSLEFPLGAATVLVEPPLSYDVTGMEEEFDNNFSLITTVTHGENRLLFTGDAEKQRVRQWLDAGTAQPCGFLKMPHHGVYQTALADLLTAVTPDYAVICASNKNPADVRTLELLQEMGVQTLQTKDGNVTVFSDGSRLEINQAIEH